MSCSGVDRQEEIPEHHVLVTDSVRTTKFVHWDIPDTTYRLSIEYHWMYTDFEDGKWKIFYDESKHRMAFEGLVKNGKLTEDAIHYWRNGAKAYHIKRNSDGKPLKRFDFDLNGNLKSTKDYSNGKILLEKTLLENGEVSQRYFSLNPYNGYPEIQLEIVLDSTGYLTEAYVFEVDTTYAEDPGTGELVEIIQQVSIPLDSL